MCKIEVNGVKITLTEEQLEQIARQTNLKKLTVKDMDYSAACKLLKDNSIDPNPKGLFAGKLLELITIIKACNFIDNGFKKWIPDFTDSSEYKYIPYFERKKSGWVLVVVLFTLFSSGCSVGLYFKKESTANLIAKKELDLYNATIE